MKALGAFNVFHTDSFADCENYEVILLKMEFEVESQEALYANKDNYLRARKLDKQTNAKKEGRRGLPLVYGPSIEFLTIPNQNLEF